MSKIVDEPKNKFPLFVKVREQLEPRACAIWRCAVIAASARLMAWSLIFRRSSRGDDCCAIRYVRREGKAEAR